MELLLAGDTTSLSYWLNWKFLLCIIWVLTPMIIASYLIWKYEGLGDSNSYKEETQQEKEWSLYDHEAWTPCVKAIHPVWLLVFRIISFCLLLSASISDVVTHGTDLFFYYTQWTLTLVTFYFAFGSLLSAYGCFRQHKTSDVGEEQDFLLPLTHEENISRKSHFLQTAAFWGYIFQIVFQTVAGAAILTDIVYWTVFVPFLTIKGYEMGFLTVLAHSLNLVLLLGDTALNSLSFPWFRISYFLLFTGFYVCFEWILHAFVATWWPYPFLDLSMEYAPLWYLIVALLHLPCYSIFYLVVKLKHYTLSRWFHQSYQCLR
ncbi:uncharacterized protein LOC112513720 isoform X1 [Cynara cardunculus var. scolymus]|uniref:uncharacterized protein LOC112513720 isoform X1 n=1 Tax=Cynara cardunculus var. scolymus TaxID=59895 RepID=UPI000D623F29|nr:uncharacterized protein LOC112513720 isoform X1 [Cynara cardunculus var. scolymus]